MRLRARPLRTRRVSSEACNAFYQMLGARTAVFLLRCQRAITPDESCISFMHGRRCAAGGVFARSPCVGKLHVECVKGCRNLDKALGTVYTYLGA